VGVLIGDRGRTGLAGDVVAGGVGSGGDQSVGRAGDFDDSGGRANAEKNSAFEIFDYNWLGHGFLLFEKQVGVLPYTSNGPGRRQPLRRRRRCWTTATIDRMLSISGNEENSKK